MNLAVNLASAAVWTMITAGPLYAIEMKQGEVYRLVFPKPSNGVNQAIPEEGRILARIGDRTVPLWPSSDGRSLEGLIGADLADPPGTTELSLEDLPEGYRTEIRILSAQFGEQRLTLPQDKVELDEATLRRVETEQARVQEIFKGVTAQRFWKGSFLIPVEGPIAGTFGRRRIINGEPRSPHTGEDINAPEGTVVRATNQGVVVLAEEQFFSGKSVIIDHGLGLYSMYFHLAEYAVIPGQTVQKGQVIGRVGATGRATGPHLHWGIRLNGSRVDPFSLTSLSLD
jgi:hypothetical protein